MVDELSLLVRGAGPKRVDGVLMLVDDYYAELTILSRADTGFTVENA